jgi:hypothetical protein
MYVNNMVFYIDFPTILFSANLLNILRWSNLFQDFQPTFVWVFMYSGCYDELCKAQDSMAGPSTLFLYIFVFKTDGHLDFRRNFIEKHFWSAKNQYMTYFIT